MLTAKKHFYNYLAQPKFNLIAMEHDFQEKKRKWYILRRQLMDFGMGSIYLFMAAVMVFPETLHLTTDIFDKEFRYLFGGICALYGGWRIFRGFKKDYFTE